MNINERRLRKLFGAHGFRVREIRNNKHWVATVERNSGGRSSTWWRRDRQAMDASLGNSSRHFDVPSARPHLDNTAARAGETGAIKSKSETMNRHERRKARRVKTTIDIRSIDSLCDAQVEGKVGQVVMIVANAKGRKAAEELWPDVQWTRDELLASVRSPEWMFTHIRVTKLPPHFEQQVPLVFASPDALAYAVAAELHHHIRTPERVMFFSGQGDDLTVNILGAPFEFAKGGTLFAEYMPPGSPLVSGNESVH